MGNINTASIIPAQTIALAIGGLGGIVGIVVVILGFVIIKYTKKGCVEDDDDKTSYDEDRAIINGKRGLTQANI